MTENIYLQLTRLFNEGRKRVIITSGQAVVFYRLAIMSKDGDWIIREDAEATSYVLQVLNEKGDDGWLIANAIIIVSIDDGK